MTGGERRRTRREKGHPMSFELLRNRQDHFRGVRVARVQVLLPSYHHDELLSSPSLSIRPSVIHNLQNHFGGVQTGRVQLLLPSSQHDHHSRLLSRHSRFFSRHSRFFSRHSRESGNPPRQDLRTFKQKRSTGLCITPAKAGIPCSMISAPPTSYDLPDRL